MLPFNLNHWICSTRVLNPRNPKLLALYSCSIWRCSASPFPGQVVGMPHAGDNLARSDSGPITNCKTFVAPHLPVKMARSDQPGEDENHLFGNLQSNCSTHYKGVNIGSEHCDTLQSVNICVNICVSSNS